VPQKAGRSKPGFARGVPVPQGLRHGPLDTGQPHLIGAAGFIRGRAAAYRSLHSLRVFARILAAIRRAVVSTPASVSPASSGLKS